MRWSETKEDKESNSMKIFLFKRFYSKNNGIMLIFLDIIENILFFAN